MLHTRLVFGRFFVSQFVSPKNFCLILFSSPFIRSRTRNMATADDAQAAQLEEIRALQRQRWRREHAQPDDDGGGDDDDDAQAQAPRSRTTPANENVGGAEEQQAADEEFASEDDDDAASPRERNGNNGDNGRGWLFATALGAGLAGREVCHSRLSDWLYRESYWRRQLNRVLTAK
jgi:hypothetical protein